MRRAWDAFWFGSGSAMNLAAARILVAVHALWILLSRDLAGISGLPPETWAGVAHTTRWRFLVFEGRPGLEGVLAAVAALALAAAACGLLARTACLVAGLLLYHLAPLETLVLTPSPYVKGLTLAVPALLALSASPCADALALGRKARAPAEAWEYAWPVRLLQLLVAQVYLFSGWAKLVRVGAGWASAENVERWLHFFNQRDQLVVFHTLGPWMAGQKNLCLAVGVSTLLLELSFVIVLVWRRARQVLVPLVALWHAGILFAMNIAFLNAPLLLAFVDWSALRRRPGDRA
jgi:vitamin K-dependent gamma-carboxylase-like protein